MTQRQAEVVGTVPMISEAIARQSADDRRREERIPSLLQALIELPDAGGTRDCQINNISQHGAKLTVSDGGMLPAAFRISIPDRGWMRDAVVKWRSEAHVGVEFVSANTTCLLQRIAVLEEELRELRALLVNSNSR